MKDANRTQSRFALILGDDELASNTVILRDLTKSEQVVIARDQAITSVANAVTDVPEASK
jgi:histidyl-tRNA synthetase